MFGQKVEILWHRSKEHFTGEEQIKHNKRIKSWKSLMQHQLHCQFWVLPSLSLFKWDRCSPNPDPVPNVLTGHQRLQVVSAHEVRRPLIDLLRNSL